jgi:hypothetical protein
MVLCGIFSSMKSIRIYGEGGRTFVLVNITVQSCNKRSLLYFLYTNFESYTNLTSLILWCYVELQESGWRSRYSDWLRAGRPTGRSSSPDRVKNVLSSIFSRPSLGSTQPSIQWVLGTLSPGVKRQGREADYSPLTSSEVKRMWTYCIYPLPHTPSWRSA